MASIKSVKGKVCLVTGGASGMGLGAVRHLVTHGAHCVIYDLPSSDGQRIAEEMCEAKGDENCCYFTPGNVCSEPDVTGALATIREKYGRLDVCVSNAGIFPAMYHPIYDFDTDTPYPLQEFRRNIEVNTVGMFNVVRLCAGLIGANPPDADGARGVIIMTGSVSGRPQIIQPNMIGYTCSKAAVNGMTANIAGDLYKRGIRVCTIAPGSFSTSLVDHIPPEQIDPVALDRVNVFPKRQGNPEADYGGCVRFCIENSLLNGSIISLDGLSKFNIELNPQK